MQEMWRAAAKFTATTAVASAALFAADRYAQPDLSEGRRFEQQTVGQLFQESLKTGDIIFFSRSPVTSLPWRGLLSFLSKRANDGQDFEHVGVIVRNQFEQYPYVLEHTYRGVQLVDFEDRILHSNSRDVFVKPLHIARTPELEAAAQQFVEEELRKDRERRQGSLIAVWSQSVFFCVLSGHPCSRHCVLRHSVNVPSGTLLAVMNTAKLDWVKWLRWQASYLSSLSSSAWDNYVHSRNLKAPAKVVYLDLEQHVRNANRPQQLQLQADQQQQANGPFVTGEANSLSRVHLFAKLIRLRQQSQTVNNLLEAVRNARNSAEQQKNQKRNQARPEDPTQQSLLAEEAALLKRRGRLQDQFERTVDEYEATSHRMQSAQRLEPPTSAAAANNSSCSVVPPFPSADLVARFLQRVNVLPAETKMEQPTETQQQQQTAAVSPPGNAVPATIRFMTDNAARPVVTAAVPRSFEYLPRHFFTDNVYLNRGEFLSPDAVIQNRNKPAWEKQVLDVFASSSSAASSSTSASAGSRP